MSRQSVMFIMNQFMFIHALIVNVLIEFVANLILCDVYSMFISTKQYKSFI